MKLVHTELISIPSAYGEVGQGLHMSKTQFGEILQMHGPKIRKSAEAMNYDLPGSLQSGVRTGAIGGLTAHSLAQVLVDGCCGFFPLNLLFCGLTIREQILQVGVVLVWMIVT